MFTLVVFTIVVGATTSGAFLRAIDDVDSFGGGFDVRAELPLASPLAAARSGDSRCRVRRTGDSRRRERVRRAGEGAAAGPGREQGLSAFAGFDSAFLTTTTYEFAALAKGYDTPRDVWHAMARRTDLAIVDQFAAPRRSTVGLRPAAGVPAHGLLHRGRDVRAGPRRRARPAVGTDARAHRRRRALRHRAAGHAGHLDFAAHGRTLFGGRATPTTFHLQLGAGRRSRRAARRLERAFLANGMEAKSDPDGPRTTRSARRTRSTGCCSASWASA